MEFAKTNRRLGLLMGRLAEFDLCSAETVFSRAACATSMVPRESYGSEHYFRYFAACVKLVPIYLAK